MHFFHQEAIFFLSHTYFIAIMSEPGELGEYTVDNHVGHNGDANGRLDQDSSNVGYVSYQR